MTTMDGERAPKRRKSNGTSAQPVAARAAVNDMEAKEAQRRITEAQKQYGRGKGVTVKTVRDKKLRGNLKSLEEKYRDATLKARDAEILLENEGGFIEPEAELERTYRVRQEEVRRNVVIETAKKGFELKLDGLGPYVAEYTRNGRDLLLAGRKGHIASIDWRSGKLGCEIQLGETVRDAKWLHNNQSFAVAQKKNVYIYDRAGVEIHRLDKHIDVTHMEFLPYHFLLSTISNSGYLKYTDTSTGQMIIEMPTKLGSSTAFRQNPRNAIMHAGHQNGTVTLWSPNSTAPLVKMLCHRGPVRDIAIDREGRYMVSVGQDSRMAVWDIRQFKEVHNHFLRQPGSSLAISDTNLTAVGWGTQVSVWRDLFRKHIDVADQIKQESPYMSWGGEGKSIQRVRWCPFEDVLGVGHDTGFSSLIIPGAGEPNFDALELNPYENVKQRQEAEVKGLLNKLQPEMISLNPDFVGNLDLVSAAQREQERKGEDDIKARAARVEALKHRGRGKNSALRKFLRKSGQKNVVTEHKLRVEELRKEQSAKGKKLRENQADQYGPALARFARGIR